MPLKNKDKQTLLQPYWKSTHFYLIASYQAELAIQLRYRMRKKTAVVTFQGDHIKQIGKDRVNLIVPDITTGEEIGYVIGYEDILTHRYIEKDNNNPNQETKKEE